MDNPSNLSNTLPSNLTIPRQFLRNLLAGKGYTEIEYLRAETERGYRTQCAKILSCLLGVSIATIRHDWMGSLDFESIPHHQLLALSYIEAANITSMYSRQIIEGKYRPQSISAQQFLEYALCINELDIEGIKARYSNNAFYGECVQILSTTIGVEPHTVILWGKDIRFQKMPTKNGIILYYARCAVEADRQQSNMLVAA
jgi:hypothetical protein